MHRTHGSFTNRGSLKKARAARAAAEARQAEDVRRASEGLHRPQPGLEPPSQENTWIDERIAAQKAREAAQNDPEE